MMLQFLSAAGGLGALEGWRTTITCQQESSCSMFILDVFFLVVMWSYILKSK
jgi:hypothetical protein